MEQKGRAHSDTLIAVMTHEHLALGQSAMMTVVWQPQPESNANILLQLDCSPRPQLLSRTSQTPARQAHIRSLCSNCGADQWARPGLFVTTEIAQKFKQIRILHTVGRL